MQENASKQRAQVQVLFRSKPTLCVRALCSPKINYGEVTFARAMQAVWELSFERRGSVDVVPFRPEFRVSATPSSRPYQDSEPAPGTVASSPGAHFKGS